MLFTIIYKTHNRRFLEVFPGGLDDCFPSSNFVKNPVVFFSCI
jgi:hypothetical protein